MPFFLRRPVAPVIVVEIDAVVIVVAAILGSASTNGQRTKPHAPTRKENKREKKIGKSPVRGQKVP